MKTKKPQRPPTTSVRFEPENLAWLQAKAAQDKRGVGPYVNLIVSRLRAKETKP